MVLKILANLLQDVARESDYIFRWGGEEFLILVSNADENAAFEFAERVRLEIHNMEVKVGFYTIKCTCSFGICEFQEQYDEKEIVKIADDHLYTAKRTGRNKVCK